jgi:hypothetical protein
VFPGHRAAAENGCAGQTKPAQVGQQRAGA